MPRTVKELISIVTTPATDAQEECDIANAWVELVCMHYPSLSFETLKDRNHKVTIGVTITSNHWDDDLELITSTLKDHIRDNNVVLSYLLTTLKSLLGAVRADNLSTSTCNYIFESFKKDLEEAVNTKSIISTYLYRNEDVTKYSIGRLARDCYSWSVQAAYEHFFTQLNLYHTQGKQVDSTSNNCGWYRIMRSNWIDNEYIEFYLSDTHVHIFMSDAIVKLDRRLMDVTTNDILTVDDLLQAKMHDYRHIAPSLYDGEYRSIDKVLNTVASRHEIMVKLDFIKRYLAGTAGGSYREDIWGAFNYCTYEHLSFVTFTDGTYGVCVPVNPRWGLVHSIVVAENDFTAYVGGDVESEEYPGTPCRITDPKLINKLQDVFTRYRRDKDEVND